MSDTNPCTITLDDGTHYDLSSLASASSDYEAVINGQSYKLNVCRAVVSELWRLDDPDTVGGFMKKEDGDFSLGQVNTTLHISPSTDEPMLYLQNGSPCPLNAEESASTAIRFICSPQDFDAGKPSLVAALPPLDSNNSCHFFFEWKTHVACRTNRKAELQSHHFIGFGVILFLIAAWFTLHTLYNRFILRKTGTDIFPIPRFRRQLPSLASVTRSNVSASSSGPRWGLGRRSQRGYQNVRADENDENEGFAGRFSLDDDDEDDAGHEDARELGGDTEAWRGARGSSSRDTQGGAAPKAGAHQGLVDV